MLVEAQQAFPEAWVGRTKDCRENRRAWDSSGCRHASGNSRGNHGADVDEIPLGQRLFRSSEP